MRIKIIKLHPDAVIPQYARDKDFCVDVTAVDCKEVKPGLFEYSTGLGFQVIRDNETIVDNDCPTKSIVINLKDSPFRVCLDARPRSSISNTGMLLANSVATLDEGFSGEVRLRFYHILQHLPRYEKGDRIGQLCISISLPIEFIEVDSLDKTERGNGGFGHTGK